MIWSSVTIGSEAILLRAVQDRLNKQPTVSLLLDKILRRELIQCVMVAGVITETEEWKHSNT
jgi:hypothetical protein